MATNTLSRLLFPFAFLLLLAAGCRVDEATVDTSVAPSAANAASTDTANSDSPIEPTAVPAPTRVRTPVPPADAGQDQDLPSPTPADLDDGPDAGVTLTSREDAIAYMINEGFAPSDVACLVDGAFAVFGTWDFVDLEPNPSQDEQLDLLLDTCVTTVPGPAEGSPPPGTDPDLDALWVACSGRDSDACDNLYFESPIDSDYEAFGLTCGGRALEDCAVLFGDTDSGGIDAPAAGSPAPGNDAELDALWVACDGGDAQACSDLFWQSPSDSDYEAFGLSCGGRTNGALCEGVLDN